MVMDNGRTRQVDTPRDHAGQGDPPKAARARRFVHYPKPALIDDAMLIRWRREWLPTAFGHRIEAKGSLGI